LENLKNSVRTTGLSEKEQKTKVKRGPILGTFRMTTAAAAAAATVQTNKNEKKEIVVISKADVSSK
jgi:hypothetical protein